MKRFLLMSLLLGGCATLDFHRADVCLRKKLEVTIPLDREPFQPKRCTSKEVFTRLFN